MEITTLGWGAIATGIIIVALVVAIIIVKNSKVVEKIFGTTLAIQAMALIVCCLGTKGMQQFMIGQIVAYSIAAALFMIWIMIRMFEWEKLLGKRN
jgi:hypothetical protein